MDDRGLSIFQGNTSINPKNDVQELQDQEDLEDQQRREEELGNELLTAFDDLIEEDENDTVNSSAHFGNHIPNGAIPTTNGHINFHQPHHGYNERHNNDMQYADNVHHNPDNQQYYETQLQQMQHSDDERIGQGDELYIKASYGSMEQLEVLYDVRVREVQRLTAQLQETVTHSEHTINELRKQLAMSEAEKSRAILSREQTQELLVQSKTETGNLLNQIDSLNANISTLEHRNSIMTHELQMAKSSLTDTHNRLQMMEKGFGNNERQVEHMLKISQERFAEETKSMETRINLLKDKVECYETDMKQLESRYKELQREKDAILIEKAESINQLTRKLEDSQRQCQLMIGSQVNVSEYKKVNSQLMMMEAQNESLKKQLKEVKNHLETVTIESGFESLGETDSIRGLRLGKSTSTPMGDHESMLRNELRRCMMGQKLKREEIKRMEDTLKTKEYEIQMLQDSEATAKLEAAHYKTELEKLCEKLAETENNLKQQELQNRSDLINMLTHDKELLQKKHDEQILTNDKLRKTINELEDKITNLIKEVQNKSQGDKIKQLQSEIDILNYKLVDAQNEVDRMKNLYIEICGSKEELIRQLEQTRVCDLEIELKTEKEKVFILQNKLDAAEKKGLDLNIQLDKQKAEYEVLSKNINDTVRNTRLETVNNCASQQQCTEHLIKIAKVETEYSMLKEKCTKQSVDIENLQAELLESHKKVTELQTTLDLKARRDYLVEDLTAKAEELMLNQNKKNNTDNLASPSTIITLEKSTSTCPVNISDPVTQQILQKSHEEALLQCENKIREDMIKLFAIEIKNINDKNKTEKLLAETQYNAKLTALRNDLEIKYREVNALKHAILLEREYMKKLVEKENAGNNKSNETELNSLRSYENQLKECQYKVSKLTAELDESTKEVNRLRDKLNQAESSLTQLQKKYQHAKNTAKNYKEYAVNKESHEKREYERIKAGYQHALEKIRNKMQSIVDEKEKLVNERILEIEAKYEEKFKLMN